MTSTAILCASRVRYPSPSRKSQPGYRITPAALPDPKPHQGLTFVQCCKSDKGQQWISTTTAPHPLQRGIVLLSASSGNSAWASEVPQPVPQRKACTALTFAQSGTTYMGWRPLHGNLNVSDTVQPWRAAGSQRGPAAVTEIGPVARANVMRRPENSTS